MCFKKVPLANPHAQALEKHTLEYTYCSMCSQDTSEIKKLNKVPSTSPIWSGRRGKNKVQKGVRLPKPLDYQSTDIHIYVD